VFAYSALGASGGDPTSPAAIIGLATIATLTLAVAAVPFVRRLVHARSQPAS
jgi:hypothetical protein